jgi:acetyl esterase/lipase
VKQWNQARLGLLAALLAISSLAFWSAENIWFFKASLVVTELGGYFALGCLVVALLPPRRSTLALGLIAASSFASTEFRAWRYKQDLPQRFESAFGSPWQPEFVPSRGFKKQVLTYDSVRGLQLSFWRVGGPVSKSGAPCLIVVHGGGWDAGSRDEFPQLNPVLASSGIAVASVEYRLAPEDPWPAQRQDLLDARAWLARHAQALGIDGQRFALLGRSAGAQVALSAAYKNPNAFRGVISLYGPADLKFAWEHGFPGDILDSLVLLSQLTGGTLAEKPEIYADASPYNDASANSPPTLLIHGGMDRLVWNAQSGRLDAKLSQSGQKAHLFLSLPWAVHAFDYSSNGPSSRLARPVIENFLNFAFKN